jgi:16S rRNA (guanine1207-N2)-methyltransferase
MKRSASVRDDLPIALLPEQEERYRAAWPSSDLLAEGALTAGGRWLLLGCAADPICLLAARRADVCLVADDDAAAGALLARQAAAANVPSPRAVDPEELAEGTRVAAGATTLFDRAIANTLYHPNKHATFRLLALGHALLAPGGQLYLAGAKNRGVLSIGDEVRRLFGNAETVALRKGQRVLVATRGPEPAQPLASLENGAAGSAIEQITARGQSLWITPAAEVFAGGRLDPAAALLAEALAVRADATVADLGCGAGLVGLVAARLAPAGQVYLLDASYAAIRCATANARRNGLGNVTALAGDGLAMLRERDVRPDVIVTNPPFHAGQVHARLVATRFMLDAAERLAVGGRLYVVANRFLPYELTLRQRFAQVREVAGDTRYKVLLAEAPQAE